MLLSSLQQHDSLKIPLVITLIPIFCLIINTHSYAYGHTEHSRAYILGYTTASHNGTQAICNGYGSIGKESADCINGYLAGLLILYPPAKSYDVGYKTGLSNLTLETVCNSGAHIDYFKCSDGFKAGYLKFEQPRKEYQFGYTHGKRDSIVYLNADDDVCKVFKSYQNSVCIDGYDNGFSHYVNVKQPNSASIMKAYKKSKPYQIGWQEGSINANETADHCTIYQVDTRNWDICENGYEDGVVPGLKDPAHCFLESQVPGNYTTPGMCHSIGEEDGMDAAYKLINNCSIGTKIPSWQWPHHVKYMYDYKKEYLAGFVMGWYDARSDSLNDDNTYGAKGCLDTWS